jgi:hypothetical protein
MSEPFLKLMKNRKTNELLTNAPKAFLLLTQIALRAKRTDDFNAHGLTVGQALIGDYKSIGLTEKGYRYAKGLLEKWGFAAFKGTNKGTIVTLINSEVYDINQERKGRTKGRTRGEPGATNKKEKKEKNTHREVCPYKSIVDIFNSMLSPTLPRVQTITEERKKVMKARWMTSEKTHSLDWWKKFFSHVSQSDFLLGQAKDGFRASFDWIMKKRNFHKIIEGNYHK